MKVEALIARPISPVANIDASFFFMPLSRYLLIFSTTTMLLSTTIPIATTIDIRVKTLIVKPLIIIVISAISIEKGIERLIIKLERQALKNNHTTNITHNPPHSKVCTILLIEPSMISVVLKTSYNLVPCGKGILLISFITAS